MAGGNTTVERLRQFLRELSPGARSMLVGELERSVLRGDEVAGVIEGATARDGELFLYALLTVMSINPTWSEGRG
jgi:hypothetical protein